VRKAAAVTGPGREAAAVCTLAVRRDRHVSSSSYDMYPPPHMTCILLIGSACGCPSLGQCVQGFCD
jgi:hypothetical protein